MKEAGAVGKGLLNPIGVATVVGPDPGPTLRDEPCILEFGNVLRDGWLADLQERLQLTNAELLRKNELQGTICSFMASLPA